MGLFKGNNKNNDFLLHRERRQHALQTNSAVQKLLYLNDADGIVNSEDTDQTAPLRSSLIRVCTVDQARLSKNLGHLVIYYKPLLVGHV